jgi:hypothetical protein
MKPAQIKVSTRGMPPAAGIEALARLLRDRAAQAERAPAQKSA